MINLKRISNITGYIKDFSFTIGSTVVVSAVMQIIVYPLIACSVSAVEYGTFLSAIGVVNILAASFGKELCNARLVCDKEKGCAPETRDYLILLFFASIVAVIVVALVLFFMLGADQFECIMTSLVVVLSIARSYFFVRFRLTLDFGGLFISNCFLAGGYLIGLGLFYLSGIWMVVFLCAETIALAYTLIATKASFDLSSNNEDSRYIYGTFGNLSVSSLVGNVGSYFDRLALPVLLSEASLSIFFAASFFGKMVFLISQPLRTMIITYIGRGKIRLTIRSLLILNLVALAMVLAFVIASFLFGEAVTRLLYPTLANEASAYIQLANIAAIVYLIYTVNSSIALTTLPSWWQMIFSVTRIALYVLFCVALTPIAGLGGYIAGILSANLIMGIFTFCVGLRYVGRRKAYE